MKTKIKSTVDINLSYLTPLEHVSHTPESRVTHTTLMHEMHISHSCTRC